MSEDPSPERPPILVPLLILLVGGWLLIRVVRGVLGALQGLIGLAVVVALVFAVVVALRRR